MRERAASRKIADPAAQKESEKRCASHPPEHKIFKAPHQYRHCKTVTQHILLRTGHTAETHSRADLHARFLGFGTRNRLSTEQRSSGSGSDIGFLYFQICLLTLEAKIRSSASRTAKS